MSRARIPSSFFVFVVVEHEGRVLVVRERKHGQRWYAPAGGLEVGEDVRDAAIRETMEEAGVLVEPTAVLRIETMWSPSERGEGIVPACTRAITWMSPMPFHNRCPVAAAQSMAPTANTSARRSISVPSICSGAM